jgi:hypothetical protein
MDSNPEPGKIEIGQDTLKNLDTLRKWTMFLSVSGFIFLGLIIILGLITGIFLTFFNRSDKIPGLPDLLMIAIFIAMALINFFPVFFLFRFSKRTSIAVSTLDTRAMHRAFRDLKIFFIYLGVLLIVVLSVYLTSVVFPGTSSAFFQGL